MAEVLLMMVDNWQSEAENEMAFGMHNSVVKSEAMTSYSYLISSMIH